MGDAFVMVRWVCWLCLAKAGTASCDERDDCVLEAKSDRMI